MFGDGVLIWVALIVCVVTTACQRSPIVGPTAQPVAAQSEASQVVGEPSGDASQMAEASSDRVTSEAADPGLDEVATARSAKNMGESSSSELASPDPTSTVVGAGRNRGLDRENPPKTARVMLLSSDGPLLIDLHVTRRGVSVMSQFDQVIGNLFHLAGKTDVPLLWKDLLSHPRFREGQFGNPPTGNYQSQTQVIRQYDTTRNDRVDRGEMVRYLTNNQTSRAISFFTSSHRLRAGREDSWIGKWLDRDGNQVLDEDEIAEASRRLLLRDLNDDGLLTFEELSESQVNNAMRRGGGSFLSPKVGWIFEADTERFAWSDILVAWENRYAAGQAVRREDMKGAVRLFDSLDVDSDGRLDALEMELLTEVDAHLSIHVNFLQSSLPEVALLASRVPVERVLSLVQHRSDRVTLKLAQYELDLYALGYPDGDHEAAAAAFEQADRDGNDLLDEAEFGDYSQRIPGEGFSTVDLNQDQNVDAAELSLRVAPGTLVDRHRVRIRADGHRDALMSSLDLNADGRLNSREVAEAGETLRSMDADEDGLVRTREISETLIVGLALGGFQDNRQDTDPLLAPPTVQPSVSARIPTWFSGMDRNGDHNISWREFLGTREQFESLDRDADGFLNVDEAFGHG